MTSTSMTSTSAHQPRASSAKSSRSSKTDNAESKAIEKAFDEAVNMTPAALGKWLDGDESKSVGWPHDRGGKESVGHKSGRRIIKIKAKPKSELTPADIAHMKKVVSYVKRHMAQRPEGDISDTNWRYSLMNWGHDPKKS